MRKLFIVITLALVASSFLLQSDTISAPSNGSNGRTHKLSIVDNFFHVTSAGNNFYISGPDGELLKLDESRKFITRKIDTLQDLLSISFIDDKNGWVVGTSGVAFKTNDGGKSWVPLNLEFGKGKGKIKGKVSFTCVEADSKNRVVIAGEAGVVGYSVDGGLNFKEISIPEDINIACVKITNDGLLVGGEFGVLYSYRGGKWHKVEMTSGIFTGEDWMNPEVISGILSIDDKQFAIIGFTGNTYTYNLKDNKIKKTATLSAPLYSISKSKENYVACGEYGKLFYSSDLVNWKDSKKDVSSNVYLRSVNFSKHSNTGVAIGGYGTVFITQDGGLNWQILK